MTNLERIRTLVGRTAAVFESASARYGPLEKAIKTKRRGWELRTARMIVEGGQRGEKTLPRFMARLSKTKRLPSVPYLRELIPLMRDAALEVGRQGIGTAFERLVASDGFAGVLRDPNQQGTFPAMGARILFLAGLMTRGVVDKTGRLEVQMGNGPAYFDLWGEDGSPNEEMITTALEILRPNER